MFGAGYVVVIFHSFWVNRSSFGFVAGCVIIGFALVV